MSFFDEDHEVDYAAILTKAAGAAAAAGRNGGDVYPLCSLIDLEHIADVDYLLPGVIQHNTFVVLYAPPGSLKSFWALDIGLRLAYGMQWLGDTLTPTGVLYVAAEGSTGMRKRIRGWRVYHGRTEPTGNFNLMPEPLNLMDEACVAKYIRTAQRVQGSLPVRLVVLDTLARCMNGKEENSSVDMGVAIAAADRIKAALPCTVMLVHHAGKDLARGARGHSSLKGAADTELTCERVGNDLKVTVSKQKDDLDGYSICFDIKAIDIQYPDKTGKTRSTLVLSASGKEDRVVRVAADAVLIANVMRDGESKIAADEIIRRLQATGEAISLNGTGRERLAAACPNMEMKEVQSVFGPMRLSRVGTKWSARLQVSTVPPDWRKSSID